MKIVEIKNKTTLQDVCHHYLDKELDFDKCITEIGEPLKIKYKDGSFFTHETVEHIERMWNYIKITTINKFWVLK